MRTFVAIDLDNRIKTNIQRIIDRLDTRDGSIKWISRQAMHITLKFLGEISESQQSDVENLLDKLTNEHSSFILQCRGTGTFPHKSRNPRVLWIGLDKNEHFDAFHCDIEEEMAGLGFPKDNRLFSPHLTLGRIKKKAQLDSVLSGLQQYHNKHFGDIIVKKVIYYKSNLKPTGAEYTVLSEHELK
ncbi:MAG: RNA 2',3'-cyclic phosphodiesterase [Candidatus Aminicenantes bacterium]|nr:RNA 2',3'-cyclic phosphodiesterase [Candidatus Aminicenantes bacterium]